MTDYTIFEAGDIELQSGARLPGAKLAYATYGALSAAKDNVVLMPTYYTGSHEGNGDRPTRRGRRGHVRLRLSRPARGSGRF